MKKNIAKWLAAENRLFSKFLCDRFTNGEILAVSAAFVAFYALCGVMELLLGG